jgi:hypothetical protein
VRSRAADETKRGYLLEDVVEDGVVGVVVHGSERPAAERRV